MIVQQRFSNSDERNLVREITTLFDLKLKPCESTIFEFFTFIWCISWFYIQVPGYSPGEPAIIDNPYTNSETDGVLVSLVSPYKDENARAFYVFLNPADMTELGRAYLPADVKVPSGFHGYWVPDDNVPV